MIDTADIRGLGRDVIANPGDTVARLVLADALEEYLDQDMSADHPLVGLGYHLARVTTGPSVDKRKAVSALRGKGWWKCTPLDGPAGSYFSSRTPTGAKRWSLIWVIQDKYVPGLINSRGEVVRKGQGPETYVILTHSELMGCAALATLAPTPNGPAVHASTEGQSLVASEETDWDWYCENCVEERRAKQRREEAKAKLEKQTEELRARLNQMGGVDRVSAGQVIMGRTYPPAAPVPNPVSSLNLGDRCCPDYEEEEDYDD